MLLLLFGQGLGVMIGCCLCLSFGMGELALQSRGLVLQLLSGLCEIQLKFVNLALSFRVRLKVTDKVVCHLKLCLNHVTFLGQKLDIKLKVAAFLKTEVRHVQLMLQVHDLGLPAALLSEQLLDRHAHQVLLI